MKQVMCRHAEDDFNALMTASGMTDAGAEVFSVVWTGRTNMLAYVVFARYEAPVTPDSIDEAIGRRLDSGEYQRVSMFA